MNILLPIETASRELIYKTYLCNELANQGFNCYLGKKTNINYLIKKLNNFIYVDKGYHNGISETIYNKIKNQNGTIVNLDEEGAIDFADDSTLLDVRYPKEMFLSVDYVFLWGQYQHNLIKSNTKKDNQLFVTGHPRFELLKNKYHSFYEADVQRIKKEHGDFILINTNMGFGNNIRGDELVIEGYSDRFPKIRELIEFDKNKRHSIVSLIDRLSDNFSRKIILRPHPEENINYYNKFFSNKENVKVIYEGSVIPWLIASNVMIHPDCTTGVESLLLGKKSISFIPNTHPHLVTKLPVEASYQFVDISEIIKFIKDMSNSGDVKFEDYSFVEHMFSFSSDSIRNVSTKIANLFPDRIFEKLSYRDSFYLKIKSYLHAFNKKNPLSANKLRGFSHSEIKKIDIECKKIKNEFKANKMTKISNQLYLFNKENTGI